MSTPQCPFRQDNSLITRNDGIRSQPPSARTSGHPARATGPFPGKGFPRTPLHRAHPRTTPPPAARSTFYERSNQSLRKQPQVRMLRQVTIKQGARTHRDEIPHCTPPRTTQSNQASHRGRIPNHRSRRGTHPSGSPGNHTPTDDARTTPPTTRPSPTRASGHRKKTNDQPRYTHTQQPHGSLTT